MPECTKSDKFTKVQSFDVPSSSKPELLIVDHKKHRKSSLEPENHEKQLFVSVWDREVGKMRGFSTLVNLEDFVHSGIPRVVLKCPGPGPNLTLPK